MVAADGARGVQPIESGVISMHVADGGGARQIVVATSGEQTAVAVGSGTRKRIAVVGSMLQFDSEIAALDRRHV